MSKTDNHNQLARMTADIITESLRATGTRTFLAALIKELTDDWAEKSIIKKRIARPVNWLAKKVLQPGMDWGSKGISAHVGRMLTELARKRNAERAADPSGNDGSRGRAVKEFLANTDFGEIREMVESSGPYAIRTIDAFNEELWKYPAKVGTLVATLIALINMLQKVLGEVLLPIEKKIGPDLFADIMLSVVKGINGADTARLVNTLQELIRRIHTGSLLLGRGGRPLFQIYLTDLLRECLAGLDPELIGKVRIALAEDGEAIANALADAVLVNPEIALSWIRSFGSVKTSRVKARSRKLGVAEELGQDRLGSAVQESVTDIDTYEVAGLINTALRVMNRIHDLKPDVVSSVLSGVADSVNSSDLRETARWLIQDIVDALKPLAPEFLPFIIRGLGEIVNPENGYASPEQKEAMEAFRTAMTSSGRR